MPAKIQPKFRGEYFSIQKLFAQVALGDYNIIVHEKHASRKCVYTVFINPPYLKISRLGIPCNSGGIISNLLLSRAYFPHLFHIISAKVKKASASLRKPSRSGRCTSAFAEVRPRSEVNTCGSDLTPGSHTGACGYVAPKNKFARAGWPATT